VKLVTLIATLAVMGCRTSSGGVFTTVEDDETAVILLTTGATSLSTLGGVATTLYGDRSTGTTLVTNRRDIRVDLARGNGVTIDDFAAELGIPEGLRPRLGAVLRRHRDQLLPSLDGFLYRGTWLRRLTDAACCDPWLYPFGRARFSCRPPGEGAIVCTP
jgi:hypothetical protein